MYQKTIYKVFSVAMALLVLMSTLSFTMEKHFCGDTLIDVAIFTKAIDCGMDIAAVSKISSEKQSCCKDELEIVKGQDTLKKTSFDDWHLEQQFFLTALVYSFTNLFEGSPEQVSPHKDYSPPHLVVDIHVLDQVFII